MIWIDEPARRKQSPGVSRGPGLSHEKPPLMGEPMAEPFLRTIAEQRRFSRGCLAGVRLWAQGRGIPVAQAVAKALGSPVGAGTGVTASCC